MGASLKPSGSAAGGRRRRARRAQPMAEINVTPFVDVMLVLLIIFMVAAPLMTVGVPVNLPETEASALPASEEEPLTVTITADDRVLVQTTEVPRAELVARLQAIAAEREGDQVYLRADGANSWDEVAKVMGQLNAAGFSNIGLVTDVATAPQDGN